MDENRNKRFLGHICGYFFKAACGSISGGIGMGNVLRLAFEQICGQIGFGIVFWQNSGTPILAVSLRFVTAVAICRELASEKHGGTMRQLSMAVIRRIPNGRHREEHLGPREPPVDPFVDGNNAAGDVIRPNQLDEYKLCR